MAHEDLHKPNGPGYEVKDASTREIVLTGIGLAVGTIIVCVAVAGLLKVLTATEGKSRQPITQIPAMHSFPPEPRLQQLPPLELDQVRRIEDERLASYGWVDKDAGRVRIPIDRAMDLVIQRGLPVRSAQTAGGSGAPKTGLNQGRVPSQGTSSPTANTGGAKGDVKK